MTKREIKKKVPVLLLGWTLHRFFPEGHFERGVFRDACMFQNVTRGGAIAFQEGICPTTSSDLSCPFMILTSPPPKYPSTTYPKREQQGYFSAWEGNVANAVAGLAEPRRHGLSPLTEASVGIDTVVVILWVTGRVP